MEPGAGWSPRRDSRVLLLSQRQLHQPTWRAMQYEFEDLLQRLDDVEVVAPGPTRPAAVSSASRRLVNGVLRHSGGSRTLPPSVFPSMRRTRLETHHDLFFAVFHYPYQLSYLHRLKGWRERSGRAACLLLELWSPDLNKDRDYLQLLRQFDNVYVFNPAVLPALVELGFSSATFLPAAADAQAFCPLPDPPSRVLDVYAYGRTSPSVHRQLLSLVEQQGLTYLYETVSATTVHSHREHRALLANMMKRARFFLAHRINDSPERRERTGGDEGMSTRYFEGAAGGAVMLGSRIHDLQFDECFDWDDAVIPLPYDSTQVADVLAELQKQPERLAAVRAANVRNSLLRHDWVHRWQRILGDSGMQPTDAMRDRLGRLGRLAETARPEVFSR